MKTALAIPGQSDLALSCQPGDHPRVHLERSRRRPDQHFSFYRSTPEGFNSRGRAETRCQEIAISTADGFYESVPINEAMDERTLLVYQMNYEPLPVEHGFPLRTYIPNHYGLKQTNK